MYLNKSYHPADGEAGAGVEPPVPETATVNSKSLIPLKDNDFCDLAVKVAQTWKTNGQITLVYITQAQFEAKATELRTVLGQRQMDGGERPSLTLRLKQADAKLSRGLKAVKRYLYNKHEEGATAQYAKFGLEHGGNAYKMPTDRTKRRDMLPMILASIEKEGLQDERYGREFWTQLQAEYSSLVAEATTKDGEISLKVGRKKVLREEVKEVLTSLVSVINGNYPKTYAAELRNWGFQKDKY